MSNAFLMFWLGRRVMKEFVLVGPKVSCLPEITWSDWGLCLKAMWESEFACVQQCVCVFVCMCLCVCFIPTLISSCHLNHTHTSALSPQAHTLSSISVSIWLWYQICPLVQTPSLLTQLTSTVTWRCVFSTLLTTLSNTHKLCFSHFLVASRWVT